VRDRPLNHIYVRKFKGYFKAAGIDIDAAENGLLLSPKDHRDLHASGYNQRWSDFFKEKRSKTEIIAFANDLAANEFKRFFEVAKVSDLSYRQWRILSPFKKTLVNLRRALPALGALGVLASSSASADIIACSMKDYAQDTMQGKDDWAYVDALSVRHELNQNGLFSGDIAMRIMLQNQK
jgi:hypothetical protein